LGHWKLAHAEIAELRPTAMPSTSPEHGTQKTRSMEATKLSHGRGKLESEQIQGLNLDKSRWIASAMCGPSSIRFLQL